MPAVHERGLDGLPTRHANALYFLDDFVYDLKWNVNSYRVIIINKGIEEPAIVCQGAALSDKAKAAIQKASSNASIYFSDIKVSSEAGTRTLDEFSVRIR